MNSQAIFIVCGFLIVFLLLIFVEAIPHSKSLISNYELKRRAKLGDEIAKKQLKRNEFLAGVKTLRLFFYILLIFAAISVSLFSFNITQSMAAAFVIVIVSHVFSGFGFVIKTSEKIFEKYETHIQKTLTKIKPFLGLFYSSYKKQTAEFKPGSEQELRNLISNSEDIISKNQKQALLASLEFESKKVGDIMTNKKHIKHIDAKELLGPLVLDDLHKIGHKHIPVINRNIDRVLGILKVDEMLTTENKSSVTAEKAMQLPALYLSEEDSLEQALAAFLHTNSPLFIVVSSSKKTAGLLSLSDVTKALIGKVPENELNEYHNIESVTHKKDTIDT